VGLPAWFLFPPKEAVFSSDAVMVLAGAPDGRLQTGAKLVEDGISQNFVVSNPLGTADKTGSAYCRGKDQPEGATQVWCLLPDPVTTVGEVMTVRELAAKEGWSSLTVVTKTPHIRRVRTMFEKCTDLNVVVVPNPHFSWKQIPYHVIREISGYLKFWVTNPCRDLPKP
jgi:uncharacterized SAM-binding protein YcdF (DUF218 family)